MSGAAFTVETPDGARLNARREGAGPALVLVSGLGGTAGFWDGVAPALTERFEVIRFDQRGIAGSTLGTAPVDIDGLARDVAAVMDAAGIGRFSFLGHSTGGCIGQALAGQAPGRLEALVLSATWGAKSAYMQALFGTRLGLLERDPEAYAASSTLISYAPEWLEANWSAYEGALAKAPRSPEAQAVVRGRIKALMDFDGVEGLDLSSIPTLLLGAEDDMIVPAFLQRALAARLPGAALHLLPDGGHFYPVSRRDDFLAAVRGFLA
ncbi:MAG: alpha/beta fold hydrolase [Pseudomonadota bacterium]|nr:alpha/beta fold hydrolase [Pseudomonadota bacterium]